MKNLFPRTGFLRHAATALVIIVFFAFAAPAGAASDNSSEVLSKFGEELAGISAKVKPAVVNISTTRTIKAPAFPFSMPFFRDQAPQKRKVNSLGSGVIASADGYILTNSHVIEGADDIIVKLSDNKEYKGRIIGLDSRSDIAVIKIDEKNLSTIKWGDSDQLKVGQVVLAVGNPFGLSQTITMGIVSAIGRSGIGITDYEDFIQTDAAINPGNSGGALVNTNGELIGLNTAIFSTSGGYQGIGFAISSNMTKNVMNSIINQGRVVRGWLGVQIQALNPELAKQFSIKDDSGVLIADVIEAGPAEKAGLKRGDIITEYDGKQVSNALGLRNLVAATAPGAKVKVTVLRNGKPLIVPVVIGELPAEDGETQSVSETADNSLSGVYVQDVTDEVVAELNLGKKIKGVLVTKIEEKSPALGVLMPGDIIMEINRKPITSTKEFTAEAKKITKQKDILVLIKRGKATLYLTIAGR
ncbi:MAG: DegQ family serine endoprotease [Nitrospiraceae bacterium]|nr:DegQ family serine endoprotease [Nitrospiraceae bacterium]